MCTTMKLAIAFVCAAVAAEVGTADAGTASCDGRLLISSDNCGTAPTALGLKLFATFKNPKTDGRTPKISCAEENYLMKDANGKPVRWDRNKNGKHRFVLKNCWSDSYANAERKNYPTRPTFMTSESDCNAMLSELSTKLGLDSAGVLVVGSQNGGVHEWMVASDDCPAAAAAINAMAMTTTITTMATTTTSTTTTTKTMPTTPEKCKSLTQPSIATDQGVFNMYSSDVVFHNLAGGKGKRCDVTSIQTVLTRLAEHDTAVSGVHNDIAKVDKDMNLRATKVDEVINALRVDVTKEQKGSITTTATLKTLASKMKAVETRATNVENMLKSTGAIGKAIAANAKGVTDVNTKVTALSRFQMPAYSGWKHGAKCSKTDHGMLRRVPADSTGLYKEDKVVFCNGVNWKQIAPMMGIGSYVKIPGTSGCKMRDVYSYNTGSGGYNRIDLKTNIKARSSVMYTIHLKGYNYGPGRYVDSAASGYTYSGWSCEGAQARHNDGNAGSITTYCSKDKYIVVRYNTNGGSYYLGFTVDATFINPTGSHMCGKFAITGVKGNSNF